MRYCENEKPEVYEAMNPDLATLLREVADHLDSLGYDFSVPTVQIFPYSADNGDFTYLAHLYVP